MRFDAIFRRKRRSIGQAFQFGLDAGHVAVLKQMRIAAGVEFDHRRAQVHRCFNLSRIRLDEQADADTGIK